MSYEPYKFRTPRKKPTATEWVTAEGEVVSVKAMKDDHIINVLRKLNTKAEALDAIKKGQGDDFLSTIPTYDALVQEAYDRQIIHRLHPGFNEAY